MTDPLLEQIFDLTISSTTQTPSRPGFGVALLMASEIPAGFGPNLVREFGGIDEVTAAGFVATNEARQLANVYFGQNPRPSKLKIAKRTAKPTRKLTATVKAPVAIGNVYTLEFDGGLQITYTVVDALVATVGAALNTLVAAPSGYSSTQAAGVLSMTALVAGDAPSVKVVQGNIDLQDTTADPGISADLDAVLAEDGDWYGLLIDVEGKATCTAAAAWAQATDKLYGYETFDSNCADPVVTTDTLSALTTLGYDHTFGTYSHRQTNARFAAAMMGRLFPYDPGTENWAFKNLTGVPVQKLSTSQFNTIDAKRGNVYVKVQGAFMTWQGKTHSGWIDQVRAIDYTQATILIDMFEVFLNSLKVPFTDFGGDQIYNALSGSLSRMQASGLLDSTREFTIIVPKAASLTTVQRASRVWPNISFTAYISGAVNKAKINGVITP